jgi:hypothetical protein
MKKVKAARALATGPGSLRKYTRIGINAIRKRLS